MGIVERITQEKSGNKVNARVRDVECVFEKEGTKRCGQFNGSHAKSTDRMRSRPLIGCAWIGRRSLKSDSKGEIWQVAPVSIRKGREGDSEVERATEGEREGSKVSEEARQTR